MLSLDLGGAFDNVSHERLLHIMRSAGFPPWIIHVIQCFLTERHTRIAFSGFESSWMPTRSGIPQGSPLSPILFLFFISELLATFERPEGETMAFGFVNDTNLVTWGGVSTRKLQAVGGSPQSLYCLGKEAWSKVCTR